MRYYSFRTEWKMFVEYNANPHRKINGDCVIRAISKATNQPWEKVFIDLCLMALDEYDLPNANEIWSRYLRSKGFERYNIPNSCPDCYTVKDFCRDHIYDTYVLGTGDHAVAVIDGNYYDTADSGEEVPVYCFRKRGLR